MDLRKKLKALGYDENLRVEEALKLFRGIEENRLNQRNFHNPDLLEDLFADTKKKVDRRVDKPALMDQIKSGLQSGLIPVNALLNSVYITKLSPMSREFNRTLRNIRWSSPQNEKDWLRHFLTAVIPQLDDGSKTAAWIVLGELSEKDAVAPLEEILLKTENGLLRHRIADTLLTFTFFPKAETAKKLLFSPGADEDLKLRILARLSQQNHRDADHLLKQAMTHPLLSKDQKDRATFFFANSKNEAKESLEKEDLIALLNLQPPLDAQKTEGGDRPEIDSSQRTSSPFGRARDLMSVWNKALSRFTFRNPNFERDHNFVKLVAQKYGSLMRNFGEVLNLKEPITTFQNTKDLFKKGLAQETFEKTFRNEFLPASDRDPCEHACHLAKNISKWAKKEFFDRPDNWWDGKNQMGWSYALSSLQGLFMVKAAPVCSNIRESLSDFAKIIPQTTQSTSGGNTPEASSESKEKLSVNLLKAGLTPQEISKALQILSDKSDEVHPSKAPSFNPLAAYGNIFYSLFLNELIENPALRSYRGSENLKKNLEEVTDRLQNNLGHFEKSENAPHDYGSTWHTFLISASAVTTNNSSSVGNKKAIDFLRNLRKTQKSPCDFPYYRPRTSSDPAETAPRSVTANLALYLDKTSKSRDTDRKSLLEALGCFHKLSFNSILQINASSYHSQDHQAVGSHYLYPNLPFITAAISRLKTDPDLTRDQEKELKQYEDGVKDLLMGLIQNDGQFRRMGTGDFAATSPAYVQPLAGLALLQFCPTRPGQASINIIPRSPLAGSDPPPQTTSSNENNIHLRSYWPYSNSYLKHRLH